jgi:hypothetical protein
MKLFYFDCFNPRSHTGRDTERITALGNDPGGTGGSTSGTDASRAAARILANTKVTLATTHQKGVVDQASAKQNLTDVANGYNAHTSNYGTALGTITPLNQKLLNGIELFAKNYTFAISEIAGAAILPVLLSIMEMQLM